MRFLLLVFIALALAACSKQDKPTAKAASIAWVSPQSNADIDSAFAGQAESAGTLF
jgi:hypothetical protein